MNILLINKFWYVRGGAETYALDTAQALKKNGHNVLYFGTRSKQDASQVDATYLIDTPHIDKKDYYSKGNLLRKAKAAAAVIYNKQAAQKLDDLLQKEKPDIAHIHNIYHHLSPSILGTLKRHDIPVVQTLHDYKRVCPNHALFTNGRVCEQCNAHKYWNAVKNKCIFGATGASAVAATEMGVQAMFGWYDRYIDRFIAPSRFMKQTMKRWGKRVDNISVLPYAIQPKKIGLSYKSVLYVGRLSKEKGLDMVLACARALPHIPFDIAGDGPLMGAIKKTIKKEKLTNITMHGWIDQKKVETLRQRSAVLLIPSQWYENYPISLLEQFACGKTAIGSDIGGIPEIIVQGKSGYVVAPHDEQAWIEQLQKLWEKPQEMQRLGKNAYKQVAALNDPHIHYEKLMRIYIDVMKTTR